jgi:hypothetical protein
MEATGQVFGYILYESTVTFNVSGNLQPGLGVPRDRVIVYVNGQKKGVIDAIYKSPPAVSITLAVGDKLWLLVENLGRIDMNVSDQVKGIVGDVIVGGTKITGWNHYNFPLADGMTPSFNGTKTVVVNGPPIWYHGSFTTAQTGMSADTFLSLPGV